MPLADAERHEFECRFGHDFAAVRVHADGEAARWADALGAEAFAAGDAIVFSRGRYAPDTAAGRGLLAHELAHVALQGGRALLHRKPARKSARRPQSAASGQSRRIVLIRAGVHADQAVGYLSDGVSSVRLPLTVNQASPGTHDLLLADLPGTAYREYRSQDGKALPITWEAPADLPVADSVRLIIDEAPFDPERFAQAQLDAVPDVIKRRLSGAHGQVLKSAEDKLGFAQFAQALQDRGVTEAELLSFQQDQRSGGRGRQVRWATEWQEAVDAVLGARGALERADADTMDRAQLAAAALSDVPNGLVQGDILQRRTGMVNGMDGVFERADRNRDEFEAQRQALVDVFDDRLRLEAAAALQRFDGALRLAREKLLVEAAGPGRLQAMAQRAQSAPVQALREQADEAKDEASRRELEANVFDPSGLLGRAGIDPSHERARAAAIRAGAATAAYETALEQLSGLPVAAWRGFDIEGFFRARTAGRSAVILRNFVDSRLRRIEWAQRQLRRDASAAWRFDVIVGHTKQALGIEAGSNAELLIDDEVHARNERSLSDKLLDLLSIALIFVPGGALVVGARIALSGVQLLNSIDEEVGKEVTADAGLSSEGGSVVGPALDAIGLAGDAIDIGRVLGRGTRAVHAPRSHGGATGEAADAERQAAKADQAGKAELAAARAADEPKVIDDMLRHGGEQLAQELAPVVEKRLIAHASEAAPASRAGYTVEVPVEAGHTAMRKRPRSWCVHSTEVCGIPVSQAADDAVDDGVRALGIEVELTEKQSERLQRIAEALKDETKWPLVTHKDRWRLGRVYDRVLQTLTRAAASRAGRAQVLHYVEITPALLSDARKTGGRLIITEGRLASVGMRIDLLEIDFVAKKAELIDIAGAGSARHLAKTAAYKKELELILGHDVVAKELLYAGADGKLLDDLVEVVVP